MSQPTRYRRIIGETVWYWHEEGDDLDIRINTDKEIHDGQVALLRERGRSIISDSIKVASLEAVLKGPRTGNVKLPTGQIVMRGTLANAWQRAKDEAKLERID